MSYRIPKIEEFVEGFEFEVYLKSGSGSYFIMDSETSQESIDEQIAVNKGPTVEEWKKFTVPKLEMPVHWYFNFSIGYFLKNKKIRTKTDVVVPVLPRKYNPNSQCVCGLQTLSECFNKCISTKC